MEADDETFVVIVGNEDEETDTGNFIQEVSIKEEYLDESTGLIEVDNVFEAVKQHGVFVDLDTDNIVKVEPFNIEAKIEYDDEDEEVDRYHAGEEYDNDREEIMKGELDRIKGSPDGRRYNCIQPCQRKSYIKEMKRQHPELKKDRKLLIETLAEIMRKTKPPPPPKDFCIQDHDNYVCTKCRKVSISYPAATRHYSEKHGERYLICYACGVNFRSPTILYKHEKRCSAPDAVIMLKARAIHVGSKGRSRPFLCKVKRGKKKPPKKVYQCNYCSATYSCKQALIPHINMHNGIRPFRCAECTASYASRAGLWRHFTKRHTNVQFICDHCNRSFSVKWALVAHLATHEPLKKYPCDLCPKRFAQKSAMLLHVHRKHYNLPPPCACEICPKRFRRMSVLKIHMKKEHGMDLVTRNMFFKTLPMMPEPTLHQNLLGLTAKNETKEPTDWD